MLTAPYDATVVIAVQQRRAGDAEALLLALHVAAGDAGAALCSPAALSRRAVLLGDVDDDDAADEQRRTSPRRSPSPGGGCRPSARTCVSAAGISRISSISRKFESAVGFSNG